MSELKLKLQDEIPWAFSTLGGTPVGECFGTSNNNERAKRNAQIIVERVNAYEELRAVLRDIEKLAQAKTNAATNVKTIWAIRDRARALLGEKP